MIACIEEDGSKGDGKLLYCLTKNGTRPRRQAQTKQLHTKITVSPQKKQNPLVDLLAFYNPVSVTTIAAEKTSLRSYPLRCSSRRSNTSRWRPSRRARSDLGAKRRTPGRAMSPSKATSKQKWNGI